MFYRTENLPPDIHQHGQLDQWYWLVVRSIPASSNINFETSVGWLLKHPLHLKFCTSSKRMFKDFGAELVESVTKYIVHAYIFLIIAAAQTIDLIIYFFC